MTAIKRHGLRITTAASALAIAVSCQNSTSPEPVRVGENLRLALSFSDPAIRPDSVAWRLSGVLQPQADLKSETNVTTITFPTESIGSDTAVLDLSRSGIRTHTLKAWTTEAPNMTAASTSDTAGRRILKQYQSWQVDGHASLTLLDYLAEGTVTGTLTKPERQRVSTAWSSSAIDSASLVVGARQGTKLDTLLARWSGFLGREEALAMLGRSKSSGAISTAQYDAMLPDAPPPPPNGDEDDPIITLVGSIGDGYVVEADTARIVFTVSDAGPLRSVKAGTESLTAQNGRYELLVRDLVADTPRSIELVAVDTSNNEARKTVTVSRRASTTFDLAGLPDSLDFPEDSTATRAFQALCPAGTECQLSTRSGDSSLVIPSISSTTSGSSLKLVPAPNRNGTTTIFVELRAGSRSVVTEVRVKVSAINDAPALMVQPTLSGTPSGTLRFGLWRVAATAGPSDESSQKLSYLVEADSAANLLAQAPVVDDKGDLVVIGKGISGTVILSVRARDDGASEPPHANTSASQRITLRLDAPPTLDAPASVTGKEDARLDLGLIKVEDLESQSALDFSWKVLDETLLPKSDVRIRTATGGYTIDVLPAPNRSGKTRIAFHVKDPMGGEAFDTTDIEILPVNDSPTIAAATGLPDTILISSLASDTSLPKLFGDIVWEPGTSSQKGTWSIALADTAQAKFFYYSGSKDGIQPLNNGGVRLQIKLDTTMLVRLVVTATDDGGTDNGGANTGRRMVLVKYTNTVKDVEGNIYTYRRMPDGYHWMEQNIRTKARNGDTHDSCAGDMYGRTPSCTEFGRLYTWQQAMNVSPTCTQSECIASLADGHKGLCPDGWHVATSASWSNLFQLTTNAGSSDSSYNLRSTDTSWSNYYSASSPMRYAGSGKYGKFLDPVTNVWGSISGAKGATGGLILWMPRYPAGYSGSPEAPPALKISWVTTQDYGGVTVPYASLRCRR